MPDINGCLGGTEVWVETKLVTGNRIKFEPTQPAWLLKRCMSGGRVFVFARQKDTYLLWTGWQVRQLIDTDIRTVNPLLKLDRPYDWPLLMEVLFTRPFPRK
jgi:hypothetical protein